MSGAQDITVVTTYGDTDVSFSDEVKQFVRLFYLKLYGNFDSNLDEARAHAFSTTKADLRRCAQSKIFTAQQHKHTDEQYPGDNCTSKMANVRGLLVLSVVCLLLCQMMSMSEACSLRKCTSRWCDTYCCRKEHECGITSCMCYYGHKSIKPMKC
ncbi:hypothetical protein LSAT2_032441 [Lamellibrachia satsuma]|nr:hypothetical protein LSAT2_032441 [Lamellibrachia satsuma]